MENAIRTFQVYEIVVGTNGVFYLASIVRILSYGATLALLFYCKYVNFKLA